MTGAKDALKEEIVGGSGQVVASQSEQRTASKHQEEAKQSDEVKIQMEIIQ